MSYSSDWQRLSSLVLKSSSRLAEYEAREATESQSSPFIRRGLEKNGKEYDYLNTKAKRNKIRKAQLI